MHPVLIHFGSLIVPSYGACAALGFLLALGLAQWTARHSGLDFTTGPRHVWNMLVLALLAALAASRLLLIALNFGDLRQHPSWLLAIAMVHHPMLAAVAVIAGGAAVFIYARWATIPIRIAADSLAAPVCLALAAEQLGALLAGSDYGRESTSLSALTAITYSSELAARWSGTPLGVPLYPVQAYAALASLALAAFSAAWLRKPHRTGDVAGVSLIGAGALLFLTECFRDWEGRGVLLGGAVDLPQLVGLGLVVCGGWVLADWRNPRPLSKKADIV